MGKNPAITLENFAMVWPQRANKRERRARQAGENGDAPAQPAAAFIFLYLLSSADKYRL